MRRREYRAGSANRLRGNGQGPENLEMMVLRARGQLARKDFGRARELLAAAIARDPRAIKPRMILTHALLQENKDPAAAERALRELLELEPPGAAAKTRPTARPASENISKPSGKSRVRRLPTS